MSIQNSTTVRIFGRFTRALAAASATAGLLCASAPAHATTAADTALSIATGILNDSVGFGVGDTIYSVFSSKGTTAVDLSEEAFEQIRDIVEDVVQTYTWMDYYNYVEDAEDAAIYYTRAPSDTSEAALLAYGNRAQDVLTKVTEAINRMEDVGMQGTPSYMMMASLQLKFLKELADIETARGVPGNVEHYLSLRRGKAREHLEYLRKMWFAFEESINDIRPIYYYPSENRYCYFPGGGFLARCISASDSRSYGAVEDARNDDVGGGSETVVGANFLWYTLRLNQIAEDPSSVWVAAISGQQIVATGNTAKCIHKKDLGFNDGNAVHLWNCTPYKEQNDTFIYEKATGYIRLQENPSACLHKKDSNWNNGNPIQLKGCNDGPVENKSWDFDAVTGYLKARHNGGKCIQKKIGQGNWDNGNPIHLWDCSAGIAENKQWQLK